MGASPASAATTKTRVAQLALKQLAELKGSDTASADQFGYAVAISGTTVVIGAPNNAQGGAAYVFTETPAGWQQSAELVGNDTQSNDSFGGAVAISGTTVVVGADNASMSGRVYVFTKTAVGWQQTAELKGSDATSPSDAFGGAVAASGSTIAVGDWSRAAKAGRVYVFEKTVAGWQQSAELKGSDTVAGDQFGIGVGLSGDNVVAGAFEHDNGAGRAYVFTNTAGGWDQTAELVGSDTQSNDLFGQSDAIAGTTIAIGATVASMSGRVYVFTKTAAGWQQTAELKGSDATPTYGFGWSVALSSGTVVVGDPRHASKAGTAWVFAHNAAGWYQAAELTGSDTAANDNFGTSVDVSGRTVVVGAPYHASKAGRSYVFASPANVTPTTVPVPTTALVPKHSVSVTQKFYTGLFTQSGPSCSPEDTVQLEVTTSGQKQLAVHTISAGAAGVLDGSNCDVDFSFEVPIVKEYVFFWRQPAYSSTWNACSPNGNYSLSDMENSGWQVDFMLEPAN
jgi:hypothetical protein